MILELILETMIIWPYRMSYHPSYGGGKQTSTDVGKIHSASLIKIQIYLSKPSHNPSISYKKTWKA